jgi:hypothetical protein
MQSLEAVISGLMEMARILLQIFDRIHTSYLSAPPLNAEGNDERRE